MSVDAASALLRWYDSHQRQLPWRAAPGDCPDPYRVWLSEVMLQQTTVATVRPYFERFTTRWPTLAALAAAEEAEVMAAWAGLGYYARARNLIACARQVADSGAFPDNEEALRGLPGIGRYTAAAISAIAFGRPAVPVDANVERVIARLFAVETPLPKAGAELRQLAGSITPGRRAGDFAQAMMDLGSMVCTPRTPSCMICPLADLCRARGTECPADYPRRAARPPKPRKQAIAYWLENKGEVLLVRRPGNGMLGGMLALPTGSWTEQPEVGDGAPVATQWFDGGSVDHVFTHFALSVRLLCGNADARRPGELWWPADRLEEAGLPTLFAKLARRGLAWRAVA